MNLRLLSTTETRNSPSMMVLYIHQYKRCAVLFEHVTEAAEFPLEFMVDKCEMGKNSLSKLSAKEELNS